MSRLSFRLLTFNVLVLFLPIGTFLFLDTFEEQLLERMERAMVQEGRLMASSLADRNLETESLRILANLAGRVESRIRIVDSAGRLVADSAVHSGSTAQTDQATPEPGGWSGSDRLADPYEPAEQSTRDELLYRVVVPPVRRVIDLFSAPEPALASAEYYSGQSVLDGQEIAAALDGWYGAATRVSTGGQRSVTLYSAIPIVESANGSVTGAVLVSRSTFRILGDLYQVRLEIITIFVYSLVAAVVLSLVLSMTITRPLRKLSGRTEELLLPGTRIHDALRRSFPALRRRDEIGELSRSLQELWSRLEARIGVIDDFTADTLHEVKNPLAAIRSSAEVVAAEMAEAGERRELVAFVDSILSETGRIDRLLGELREITTIDAHLEWEVTEPVDVAALMEEMAPLYEGRTESRGMTFRVVVKSPARSARIRVNRDRLQQVVQNLLDNAVDFATSTITATLDTTVGKLDTVVFAVEDDGPGIPEDERERIFRRFYSGRETRGQHDGLGLAICRAIVTGYGGSIEAVGGTAGGARFEVRLPVTGYASAGSPRGPGGTGPANPGASRRGAPAAAGPSIRPPEQPR